MENANHHNRQHRHAPKKANQKRAAAYLVRPPPAPLRQCCESHCCPPSGAPSPGWFESLAASFAPALEASRCEAAARFSRATVWKTSGSSGLLLWLDPGSLDRLGEAGASQRVIRTASGIPKRFGCSLNESAFFILPVGSPQSSYQSKPS